MDKSKIFITGGHLTPAIAITDLLITKGWKIWYVGRKHAQEEDKSVSVEYQTIKSYKSKLEILLIRTGKLQRYLSLKSVLSLLKIPIGFLQSVYWLIKYQPSIVLSFGGYVAVPVTFAAWIFGIPVITHEQTQSPGIANKLIALIASKICLTWKNQQNFFPENKTILTGLPLRKEIWEVKKSLPISLNKPLIYISGGSLGSHTINQLLIPIIPRLIKDFSIIHQCGDTQKYNDYDKLFKLRSELPATFKKNYLPIKYINVDYLGWVYKKAAFCISRAGANTVYEFAVFSLPAIFIPIPWSSGNEQYQNAQLFVQNTCGIILDQNKINSEKLYQQIFLFNKNLDTYRRNVTKLKNLIFTTGSRNLLQVIEKVVNEENKNPN